MNFLKIRVVRSRFYGHPQTYEALIISGPEPGRLGKTLARSRGHGTREAAQAAGCKLAERRDIKLEDDPTGKKLRAAEFNARYGEWKP